MFLFWNLQILHICYIIIKRGIMKTKDALQMLHDYLSEYNDFKIHPLFLKELGKCLKKDLKGVEADFLEKMATQLSHIKNSKKMVYRINGNEILSGIGNDSQGQPLELYSIHMSSKTYNIRFLIKFDENATPYLLCAFYERAGKQITDYTIYKETAINRFLELHD